MHHNDKLKAIGLAVMVIDHISLFCFDGNLWLYSIARFLGFPFFAYGIAISAMHTSKPLALLKRLFIFGLICQPVFYYATDAMRLNVVFTLLLGAGAVMLWRSGWRGARLLACLIPFLGGSWQDMTVGYGWYGIASVLSFGISPMVALMFQLFSSLYFLQIFDVQFLAVLSLVFIYKVRLPNLTIPRWFYYVSYPGHLSLIALYRFLA